MLSRSLGGLLFGRDRNGNGSRHTLLWEFFLLVSRPPQKPESIKAIMLGGPNREGRGRALQRLNEAGRGGKWLSPVVCCPGGSKVLTVVPQQTQEESMGGQKVNCKADGTSW